MWGKNMVSSKIRDQTEQSAVCQTTQLQLKSKESMTEAILITLKISHLHSFSQKKLLLRCPFEINRPVYLSKEFSY